MRQEDSSCPHRYQAIKSEFRPSQSPTRGSPRSLQQPQIPRSRQTATNLSPTSGKDAGDIIQDALLQLENDWAAAVIEANKQNVTLGLYIWDDTFDTQRTPHDIRITLGLSRHRDAQAGHPHSLLYLLTASQSCVALRFAGNGRNCWPPRGTVSIFSTTSEGSTYQDM